MPRRLARAVMASMRSATKSSSPGRWLQPLAYGNPTPALRPSGRGADHEGDAQRRRAGSGSGCMPKLWGEAVAGRRVVWPLPDARPRARTGTADSEAASGGAPAGGQTGAAVLEVEGRPQLVRPGDEDRRHDLRRRPVPLRRLLRHADSVPGGVRPDSRPDPVGSVEETAGMSSDITRRGIP